MAIKKTFIVKSIDTFLDEYRVIMEEAAPVARSKRSKFVLLLSDINGFRINEQRHVRIILD